jgi:hypothetical protein
VRLRDVVGLSERRQAQLTWLMEASLVGLFFIGIDRGSPGIAVNAALALAVTQLPPVLARDYDIAMDPALVLWITTAAFLHALGTVGVPGSGLSFYRSVWWWDHLTHTLSSSVVAGVGYAFVRAVQEHSDDLWFPPAFTFAFILLVVLAFGVFWEVIEFAVGRLGDVLGSGAVLTQYGLEDTMKDLLFDTLGALVVAVGGTAYLSDLAADLARILDARAGE